jgi:osmotically-inducible protein OsmY
MSNEDIEANVSDELLWDPKVAADEIGVFANDGVVTLRGTVGSFRMKREAKKDAERVYGVNTVHNELQVRILDDDRRDDADLRGAVLQALSLDSLIRRRSTRGRDGLVTLSGQANWPSVTKPSSSQRASPV